MLITARESGPPEPGSVDIGFAHDMQVHHLQAVTMATIARERTTDSQVKLLAIDIDGSQGAQIGMMLGWLGLWQQPELPPPGSTHLQWIAGDHRHNSGAAMPGMATPAVVGVVGWIGRPKRWGWFATAVLAFGLVHGLGLSSRLQALGMPQDGRPVRTVNGRGGHPHKDFFEPDEPLPEDDFGHVIGDGFVIVRYSATLPVDKLTHLRDEFDLPALKTFTNNWFDDPRSRPPE